jgi:hypothetical protein
MGEKREGRTMEKVGQTNKNKHNKTAKIIWESIYPLRVLIVKEDCR